MFRWKVVADSPCRAILRTLSVRVLIRLRAMVAHGLALAGLDEKRPIQFQFKITALKVENRISLRVDPQRRLIFRQRDRDRIIGSWERKVQNKVAIGGATAGGHVLNPLLQ
jgi:hypothetical protein